MIECEIRMEVSTEIDMELVQKLMGLYVVNERRRFFFRYTASLTHAIMSIPSPTSLALDTTRLREILALFISRYALLAHNKLLFFYSNITFLLPPPAASAK